MTMNDQTFIGDKYSETYVMASTSIENAFVAADFYHK